MDEQNVNTVVAAHDFDRVMAFDKLNEEMNSEHSPSEDIFHNWLCEQMETDDELIHGVLKSDRTIKGALKYCSSKAIKLKTMLPVLMTRPYLVGFENTTLQIRLR